MQESDVSLSCNLWIADNDLDGKELVKEAATRFLYHAFVDAVQQCGIDTTDTYSGWSNPVGDLDQDVEETEPLDTNRGIIVTSEHAQNLNILLEAFRCYHEDFVLSCEDVDSTLKCLLNSILAPDVLDNFVSNMLKGRKKKN